MGKKSDGTKTDGVGQGPKAHHGKQIKNGSFASDIRSAWYTDK